MRSLAERKEPPFRSWHCSRRSAVVTPGPDPKRLRPEWPLRCSISMAP
jgi:hypothetical protein